MKTILELQQELKNPGKPVTIAALQNGLKDSPGRSSLPKAPSITLTGAQDRLNDIKAKPIISNPFAENLIFSAAESDAAGETYNQQPVCRKPAFQRADKAGRHERPDCR